MRPHQLDAVLNFHLPVALNQVAIDGECRSCELCLPLIDQAVITLGSLGEDVPDCSWYIDRVEIGCVHNYIEYALPFQTRNCITYGFKFNAQVSN